MADEIESSLGATALGGTRVLDFTHVLAGPYCSRLLADLGADVVRVETATRPDRLGVRKAGRVVAGPSGRAPLQVHSNRNKRSVTINLKSADGLAVAERLIAGADVLVENFSSGVLERLGLGWDQARRHNPGLVYVSMSGYGQDGPRRAWRAMNMNIQAHSGLMQATGAPGDPPTAIANSWCDYIAGLHACFAVVAALDERRTTGEGQRIDLSQFETNVATLGPALVAAAVDQVSPGRRGNRSRAVGPEGCYRCGGDDQWVAISVTTDGQWQALVDLVGGPQAPSMRDASARRRAVDADDIDGWISAWTAPLAAPEVERQLREVGVPASVVRRVPEMVDGPGRSRVFVSYAPDGDALPMVAVAPFAFSRSEPAPLRPTPAVGEHTSEVLSQWAGLTDEEITRLRDEDALT